MRLLIIISCICIVLGVKGQHLDLTVPVDVANELQTKTIQPDSAYQITYKVVRPKNFDPKKKYPVFVGLGGGSGTGQVIDYCYHTLFRSSELDGYIKVFPIAPKGINFTKVDSKFINGLLNAIPKYEMATKDGWIIAGTSNGGVGAFNFAHKQPQRFKGLFVVPGVLAISRNVGFPKEWASYHMMMCVGEKDTDSWVQSSKVSTDILKKEVFSKNPNNVVYKLLPGQGHIVDPSFDMDPYYKEFLSKF